MRLTFCGGAGEVGASCVLLQLDGKNILLDCGIRMKGGKDALPDFRSIQDLGGVDAVFTSHAHMDHTGSLPVISREYPGAAIYMTHATKDLARVLLYDSLKIMDRQEAEIPIYAENHVLDMLQRVFCYSPQYTFKPFNDCEIKVTFYHAGHIAGAVLIYIQGKEGTVLYTGDISLTAQQTVTSASIPKLRPDVIIMESTYGDKLHSNRQMEETRLVEMMGEVMKKGGKILIPAFALGRAQEIILLLKKAINKKHIPETKIYVDGMVRAINRVYKMNPNYLVPQLAKKIFRGNDVFYDDNIIPVEDNDIRQTVIESREPLCVVSSSGMLTGGPSSFYAEKFAGNEKNFIAITGYQDEEAPGRRLLELLDNTEGDRVLPVNNLSIPLKCGIGKYGLSAHADKNELLGILHKLAPRRIFLVHGDPAITAQLASEVNSEIHAQVFVPANGDEYDLQVRKPRKQLDMSVRIQPLLMNSKLDGDNLETLWRYLLRESGVERAFSVEELLYVWKGSPEDDTGETERIRELLNSSEYFSPNTRKLFLYHPVAEDELEPENDGIMELNEMLAYVDGLFPEEAGLYKKGARYDEKICILNFNFPLYAAEKYGNLIDRMENDSGWKAEVNSECNLIAAEELIHSLMPEDSIAEKISYYRDKNKFAVTLGTNPQGVEQIKKQFSEMTGMQLDVNVPGIEQHEELEIAADADMTNMMEQNMAFACIDTFFKDKSHKVYKKSRKLSNGVPYMELSFITPEVGRQYKDELLELEKQTGWRITIATNPNLNEIIKVVKTVFREEGTVLAKNPGIHQGETLIRVKPKEALPVEKQKRLHKKILEETGYNIHI